MGCNCGNCVHCSCTVLGPAIISACLLHTAGKPAARLAYGASASAVADEGGCAAESLRLVAEFPRPLRLYVLFLEAADSHRLNAHLAR